MEMYKNSVGHNSTFILRITLDIQGLVPGPDAKRMMEFGEEIYRQYGYPIAQISGEGKVVNLELENPQKVNQDVLQEDIIKGERVREFKIQGKVNEKWINLYEDTSIDPKHIGQFENWKVSPLKVKITKSV